MIFLSSSAFKWLPSMGKKSQYTGEKCSVHLGDGSKTFMKIAKVKIEVDGIEVFCKAVVRKGQCVDGLLGADHPVVQRMLESITKPCGSKVSHGGEFHGSQTVHAITRAMCQAHQDEITQNTLANAKDGAIPTSLNYPKASPCALSLESSNDDKEGEIVDSPSVSPLGEEEAEVEVVAEEEVEEDLEERVEEAEVLVGLECVEAEGKPLLPDLSYNREGVSELIRQQKEDVSLFEMMNKAEHEENGYYNNGGVLMHTKLADQGEENARIVVPLIRRSEIMNAGNSGLIGGHFSHNRMAVHIKSSFTWPGLDKDVRRYCAACPECQKAGRSLLPKVPMVATPIISTPYHRMAFDIVGPVQRTKSGYGHVLTLICMGTR